VKIRNIGIWASVAAITGALGVGCIHVSVHPPGSQIDKGASTPEEVFVEWGGPSPTSGTLPILLTGFSGGNNNSSPDCFPASAGWNAYYVTGYFYGPFSSEPPSAAFPNGQDKPHLTIDTLATQNGTTLDTGILIAREFQPSNPTNRVCNDFVFPPPAPPMSTNLSSATFTNLNAGKRYRVTIFYKTPTATGLTTIVMNWTYH